MTNPLFDQMVARHEDFVRRFNVSDAERSAETFYSADATMLPPDRSPIVGRDAIRHVLQVFHAKKSSLRDTVTCSLIAEIYRNVSDEMTKRHGGVWQS
jgi:ketosteroid isomerase-like protein